MDWSAFKGNQWQPANAKSLRGIGMDYDGLLRRHSMVACRLTTKRSLSLICVT